MWIAIILGGIVLLLLAGLLLRRRFPKWGKTVLLLTVIGGSIMGIGTVICWSPPETAQEGYDYAILLGALLEDGEPTPELERRMKTALRWQQTDDEGILFVSGGEPEEQGITEAQVMYNWLKANGADMTRVVMEEQAKDTRQNLLYTKAMAEEMGLETDTVLLITSDYHQTRAGFLARQLGQKPLHLSSHTPFCFRLDASLREVLAFVKAFFETL